MSGSTKQTLEEGYNKFVVRNPHGCWGWTGCAPKNPGYGQFRYSMKLIRAHRASWIIHKGPIPKDLFVLHKCDNMICSNPDHLFLGSNLDNIRDMMEKNRHRYLGKKGSNNHKSSINEEMAKKIKAAVAIENSINKVSEMLNISKSIVRHVKYGNTWKEVVI